MLTILILEIELPQLRLIEGMNYFVSVTACNVADLCTTVSSDGFVLDRSPPSPGRVLDGTQGHDIMYQASRYQYKFFKKKKESFLTKSYP